MDVRRSRYLIAPGDPNSKYELCYKVKKDAAGGIGPCGSWCANSKEWPIVKSLWGDKCGSLCPPLPPPPAHNHTGASL